MRFHKNDGIPRPGRPKGNTSKYTPAALQASFKKAAKKHGGVAFLDHITDQAYTNPHIAIALIRKLMPDLKSLDVVMGVLNANLSKEEAEQVRAKLMSRFDNKEQPNTTSEL